MNDAIIEIFLLDTWPFIEENSLRLNKESDTLAPYRILGPYKSSLPRALPMFRTHRRKSHAIYATVRCTRSV